MRLHNELQLLQSSMSYVRQAVAAVDYPLTGHQMRKRPPNLHTMHINSETTTAAVATTSSTVTVTTLGSMCTFLASKLFLLLTFFSLFPLLPFAASLLGQSHRQAYLLSNSIGNNFSDHDTKIDSMSSLFGNLIDMSNQAAEMCPQNAARNDTDNNNKPTSRPVNQPNKKPKNNKLYNNIRDQPLCRS